MSSHIYRWSGINKGGRHVKGTLLASTTDEVLTLLRDKHITIIRLKKQINIIFSKIKTEYINQFFQQLEILLASGIVLIAALKSIQKNFANKQMQNMIVSIQADLKNGYSFSFALHKYPDISNLYCQLIHIAEHTGTLPQVLKKIVEHQRTIKQVKSKLKKALIYPVTVLCMASVAIGIIFSLVLPQFSKLFAQFNVELPLYTRLVIAAAHNFLYVVISIFGLIGTVFFLKNSTIKHRFEKFILHFPLIGKIYKEYFFGIFSLSLSILLKTQIPLPEALIHASKTFNSTLYNRVILQAHDHIISGISFSTALKRTRLFPKYFIHMVETGEETGKLDVIFATLTDFYQLQLHNKIETFTKLFEPLLMVFLGIALGMVVIALYLPIFKLGSVM